MHDVEHLSIRRKQAIQRSPDLCKRTVSECWPAFVVWVRRGRDRTHPLSGPASSSGCSRRAIRSAGWQTWSRNVSGQAKSARSQPLLQINTWRIWPFVMFNYSCFPDAVTLPLSSQQGTLVRQAQGRHFQRLFRLENCTVQRGSTLPTWPTRAGVPSSPSRNHHS